MKRSCTQRIHLSLALATTPPVLNIGDFSCFLNRFAAGCP
jgi:hypothetical protein